MSLARRIVAALLSILLLQLALGRVGSACDDAGGWTRQMQPTVHHMAAPSDACGTACRNEGCPSPATKMQCLTMTHCTLAAMGAPGFVPQRHHARIAAGSVAPSAMTSRPDAAPELPPPRT